MKKLLFVLPLIGASLFGAAQSYHESGGKYYSFAINKGPGSSVGFKTSYTFPGGMNLFPEMGVDVNGTLESPIVHVTTHLKWVKGDPYETAVRPVIRAGFGYGLEFHPEITRLSAMGEFSGGLQIGHLEFTAGLRTHGAFAKMLNGLWLSGGITF